MRFLCLIYTSVDVDGRLTQSEMNHLIAEHFVYDESLRQDGRLIVSDALELRDKSIVIRPQGDTFSVTDGPFVETKEHLAGFYLIDAPALATSARTGLQRALCPAWTALLPPVD